MWKVFFRKIAVKPPAQPTSTQTESIKNSLRKLAGTNAVKKLIGLAT